MKNDRLVDIIINEAKSKEKERKEGTSININLNLQVEKTGLVYVYDEEKEKWMLISKDFSKENPHKPFTENQLIEHLRIFIESSLEEGGYPSISRYSSLYDSPSIGIYRRKFSTWKEALQKTGVYDSIVEYLIAEYDMEVHPALKRYTKEELLNYIINFVNTNPEEKTSDNFFALEKRPNVETYKLHFGSWENALQIVLKEKMEYN